MAEDVAFQFCSCALQGEWGLCMGYLVFCFRSYREASLLVELWLIKGCAFEMRMWKGWEKLKSL
jgi:hypothetical protein